MWGAATPQVHAAGVADARAEQVKHGEAGEGRERAQPRVAERAAVRVQLRQRRQARHCCQARVAHARCAKATARVQESRNVHRHGPTPGVQGAHGEQGGVWDFPAWVDMQL